MRYLILLIVILVFSCDSHKQVRYVIINQTDELVYNTVYYGEITAEDSLQFKPNQSFGISGGAHFDSDSTIFWSADSKQTKVYRNGRFEDTSSFNHFYNEENWLSDDGFEFYYYFSEENFN